MTKALRQIVKIQPGGVLEIRSPELPEGKDADVIVLIDETPLIDETENSSQPLSKFFGAAKGCHSNANEADAFLRQERDQWD